MKAMGLMEELSDSSDDGVDDEHPHALPWGGVVVRL